MLNHNCNTENILWLLLRHRQIITNLCLLIPAPISNISYTKQYVLMKTEMRVLSFKNYEQFILHCHYEYGRTLVEQILGDKTLLFVPFAIKSDVAYRSSL
jgi:hypothetical protein